MDNPSLRGICEHVGWEVVGDGGGGNTYFVF